MNSEEFTSLNLFLCLTFVTSQITLNTMFKYLLGEKGVCYSLGIGFSAKSFRIVLINIGDTNLAGKSLGR